MYREFSIAELEAECAELLPTREALALIDLNIGNIGNIGNIATVVGVNQAFSISALSHGTTGASAGQALGALQSFLH